MERDPTMGSLTSSTTLQGDIVDATKLEQMHESYWIKYYLAMIIVVFALSIYVPFISKYLTYAAIVQMFLTWVWDFSTCALAVFIMRASYTDIIFPDGDIPGLKYVGWFVYLFLMILSIRQGMFWMYDSGYLESTISRDVSIDATTIAVVYLNMWIIGTWGFDIVKDPKEYYQIDE